MASPRGLSIARPLPVTSEGLPTLLPQEVTYRLQEGVDVYDGDVKSDKRKGVAIVTSHRLVWMAPDRTSALYWALDAVASVSHEEAGILSSAKLVVAFHGVAVSSAATAAAAEGYDLVVTGGHIKLSFKEKGKDPFGADLSTALTRRSWLVAPASLPKRVGGVEGAASSATPVAPPTGAVGIAGILAARAAAQAQSSSLTADAFKDIDELAKRGRVLVALAASYAAEASAREARLAGGGGAPPVESPDDGVGDIVSAIGILNPVTRASTGGSKTTYLREVARQLASALRPLLLRSGGVLPLVDAYCAYNRARGLDLVSPEDMRGAAELCGALNLGMRLVRFPSGLLTLQLDEFSADRATERIIGLLDDAAKAGGKGCEPFLTSETLAKHWGGSLTVAGSLLGEGWARCRLVQDDSLHGLRFYRNRYWT